MTRDLLRALPLVSILAAVACDGAEKATITPDPARTTAAPSDAPGAQLERSAPPLSSAPPSPTASAPPSSTSPISAAAPTASAPAPSASAPSKTAARNDPPNPCVAHYEERVDADGKTTRVWIPKDKRCGQLREGGLSPKGTVYGN